MVSVVLDINPTMIATKIVVAAIGLVALALGGNGLPRRVESDDPQWRDEIGVSNILSDMRFESDVLARADERNVDCSMAAILSAPFPTRDGVVDLALTRNHHFCNSTKVKVELRLYYDRRYLNIGCMGLNSKPWMKAGELIIDLQDDNVYEWQSLIFQLVQTKNKLPLLIGFLGKTPILNYKPDVNNLRYRDYWACYNHILSPILVIMYNSESVTVELPPLSGNREPLVMMYDIHKLPDTPDNVKYS